MAEVQRDVTFKQSSGRNRAGEVVYFAQDEILLNGMRVGYVGHGEGEAANLIRPADEGTKKAIADAIAAHRGSAPSRINTAPTIPDEADTEEDDE